MPKDKVKGRRPTRREQVLGTKLFGAMLGVPQWRLAELNRDRAQPRPTPFVPKAKGKKQQ
jgi:hypothetical protein